MSEVLNIIDVNDYGLQKMKSEGGGGEVNLQSKTATPSTSQQVVTADSGYDGLDKVTVGAVTSAIDNNIQSSNIKKNVSILGVTGNYDPQPNLQSKDVTINQNGTTTIEADQGYDGLSDVDVTVSGVLDTSDANATSDDIRAGKTAYVNGTKRTGIVPVHKYGGLFQKYTDAEQFTPGTMLAIGRYIAVAPAVTSGYVGSNFIVDDDKLRVGVPNSMLQSAGGITSDKIKVGESIYGVTGTFTGDADATASDILSGKIAYVNGQKITGTYTPPTPTQE